MLHGDPTSQESALLLPLVSWQHGTRQEAPGPCLLICEIKGLGQLSGHRGHRIAALVGVLGPAPLAHQPPEAAVQDSSAQLTPHLQGPQGHPAECHVGLERIQKDPKKLPPCMQNRTQKEAQRTRACVTGSPQSARTAPAGSPGDPPRPRPTPQLGTSSSVCRTRITWNQRAWAPCRSASLPEALRPTSLHPAHLQSPL